MKTAPPPAARFALLALLLLGLALLAGGPSASAATPAPPDLMSYQGYLVDVNGVALATNLPANYPVNFRIYDASTAGNILWSELQVVTVDKGNFSVILGQGSGVSGEAYPALSTVFSGATTSDRYLGITVTIGGTAMIISPRLRLLPSPYAFAASKAMSLDAQGVNRLGGNPLFFNTASDLNNGLGYASVFGGVSIGGPALFGSSGGVLGTVANATNQTPALVWNSSGNVGIGTGANSIGARLEVANGGIRIDGNNTLEFGGGVAKDTANPPANGTIAYKKYSAGLDILGAGVSNTDRQITLFGNGGINMVGPVQMSSGGGVSGNNALEFGQGVAGKDSAAGKIGYGTFSGDSLDIVGAGTSIATRKIHFFNDGGATFAGYIGVGTSTPRAPLEINGGGWVAINYYYLNGNGSLGSNPAGNINQNNPYSIIGSHRILCSEINLSSDRRIKQVVGVSDRRRDLETIQKLKVTDYQMVDRVAEGDALRKGFIAQEVQAVIPEAVTLTTQFVPDIYSLPSAVEFDEAAHTLGVTMTKAHGLKSGDRVRIMADKAVLEFTVTAVPSAERFVVEKCEKKPEKVFVWGKQVSDFHQLHYDRIFTTGISAIQELARRVEGLESREARVAELEKKASKVETLERELAELRKVVAGLAAKPASVATASREETASASVNQ